MNDITIPTGGRHALQDDSPPSAPQPAQIAAVERPRHAEFPVFSGDLRDVS